MEDVIPRIPVGDWIDSGIDWLNENLKPFWDFIGSVLQTCFDSLSEALLWPPTWVIILIAVALAWASRSWKFALFTVLGLTLVESMELWNLTMDTLAMVVIATIVAAIVGIPIGILAGRKGAVSAVVRPVLDFMQTLHPYVYLVPMIAFFQIGEVPGIVATIIFAIPPGVRLTELGIRQVDKEMVEAGDAFGARPIEVLTRIQIPLALSTIMAGINQVIMLSLSMVVLAGIVGAGGLGGSIVFALSRVDVGQAFEAGIAVVVLAIFLDRLTGAIGQRSAGRLGIDR